MRRDHPSTTRIRDESAFRIRACDVWAPGSADKARPSYPLFGPVAEKISGPVDGCPTTGCIDPAAG